MKFKEIIFLKCNINNTFIMYQVCCNSEKFKMLYCTSKKTFVDFEKEGARGVTLIFLPQLASLNIPVKKYLITINSDMQTIKVKNL